MAHRSELNFAATSTPTRVELISKPQCPKMTVIGMRSVLPYRALFPEEEFLVTITASSGSTTLDQFFIPLYYDVQVLEYLRFSWDSRWKEPIVSSEFTSSQSPVIFSSILAESGAHKHLRINSWARTQIYSLSLLKLLVCCSWQKAMCLLWIYGSVDKSAMVGK